MKNWKVWKRFTRRVRCAMSLHDLVVHPSVNGYKVRWCRHCGQPYTTHHKGHK